jgi:predicted transcriptional regulator
MDFLVKRGLVTREGDLFAITEKGRAFLMWRIFARKGPRAG